MNPRLGFLLMFEGDYRIANVTIKNVTAFTAVSGILKNGDNDITGTYVSGSPSFVGNLMITGNIGGAASIPPGNYRYFLSGTYGGKRRTWFWEILVLPKDLSILAGMEIPLEDYDPFVEQVTIYEGDKFAKTIVIPGAQFDSASGTFRMFADDVTATYCSGSPTVSNDTITTHNIGVVTTIPAGDYGYFLTGHYFNNEVRATWFFQVKCLPKQGAL